MYRVRARNTAATSANKIHDDTVAKQFGFGGGLVPGVTLFAYMTHPVVDMLGPEFLDRGRMEARFVEPVYDGEEVVIEATADLDLRMRNSSGALCATGAAGLSTDVPNPDLNEYPSVIPVSPPPIASEEAFKAHPVLGTIEGGFDSDSATAYLELIGDDLEVYGGLAHPGWLLTWANLVLSTNFRLGPWIHVSSDVLFLSRVIDGDKLQARGRVEQTFERKDHRFVELDVVLIANESRPAMKVRHVAIYEPRQVG